MQYHITKRKHVCLCKPFAGALFASAFLSAAIANADVTPFVDYYSTNDSANTTAETNAAINLLNGYTQIWNIGDAWNTGSPTSEGAAIYAENIQYVVDVTQARTQTQAESSYLIDRRDQSYSAIVGLGDLADDYRNGAGAYTTISDEVPAEALGAKYDDKGNGAGDNTSELGAIVTLVQTLRGNNTSTSSAKSHFRSPRPWRVNSSGAVVELGTEKIGYYTSTLSDGTPDYTTALFYFPSYDTDDVLNPYMMPGRSTTPASDGGFPSGHTNAGYLASFAFAYAVPQRYASAMLNASEIGESRIITGMHSAFDVMGGRLEATALAAAILYRTDNDSIKTAALKKAQSYFATKLEKDVPISQSEWVAGKELFTKRLTYGLTAFGDTTLDPIVPKGAEALLTTRFPYLDTEQRREVLRTTEIASGSALDDSEGWNRLNLYAASGAYGSFDSTVTVDMDASLGGLSAKDYWRNDISGIGGLVKQGSGTLVLTGSNTYTGTTQVEGGKLVITGRIDSTVVSVGVDSGALVIEDGAVASFSDCYVGSNGAGSVSLTGAGSLLEASGAFSLGSASSGTVMINNDAMFVTSSTVEIGNYGTICLADGNWAVMGEKTAEEIAAGYSIEVYDGTEWKTASASDLTVTYYDGATNIWSSDSLYSDYGSKINLTGYTVVSGGSSYLDWSDGGAPINGWNDSSWYGSFYTDTIFGNWIYHENHGWQYIFDVGDEGIYIYDVATGSWWFTTETFYPYIYDYGIGSWLYYVDGTTPYRNFWSYAVNGLVSETK
jgi:autotransporter-associated beta strand protein/T5SS/PEP-CTERM-associated repeat protein